MFSPSNNINNYPDLGLEQSSSMDPGNCYPMNAYTQAPSYQFRGYNRLVAKAPTNTESSLLVKALLTVLQPQEGPSNRCCSAASDRKMHCRRR
jgi:hypothetical protein